MNTLAQDPEPVMPPDLDWFSALLLQDPRKAVQTIPVIAMVAELLNILNDEQVSDQDAHRALTRAVRWLRVFAGDPGRSTNRPTEIADGRDYTPSQGDLAAAAGSRRLATAWLRGTPQAAIRTDPVIAVVRRLKQQLQWTGGSRQAQITLRHAVNLLSVFVTDDNISPRP
jgi:hypothetical protein